MKRSIKMSENEASFASPVLKSMERRSHLLFIFCFVSVPVLATSSPSPPEQDGHVCISQGGRFPRFSSDGQFPRQSPKGPDDLSLCRVYRKRTCCSAAQTHPALVAIRKLSSDGEGSQECLMFWEAMECSICDPRVGVKQGPPVLCVPFCESVLRACGDAFFSFDPVSQVLTPCGPRDTVCARAKDWLSNGTAFCQLAGFAVPSSKNIGSTFCFDGKSSVDTVRASSQETVKKRSRIKVKSVRQRLRRLVRQMDTVEAILWAIGGLVLTGGAILIRRRCLSSQQKKSAMLRIVQEARSKQLATKYTANKRIGKRG